MLGELISPKIGLGLIKKQIEKQTKLIVKDFSIVYIKFYSSLKFHVTDEKNKKHKFPFSDDGDQCLTEISL